MGAHSFFLLARRAALRNEGRPFSLTVITPTPPPPALTADANKDHLIEKDEFRASMSRFLALTEKEIDMLIGKFYGDDKESLNYDDFMGTIHKYCDAINRT